MKNKQTERPDESIIMLILDAHMAWLDAIGIASKADFMKWGAERYHINNAAYCADFSEMALDGVDFSKYILSFATLTGASLHNANLSHVDLQEAILTRADLSRANLRAANLRCADLHDADLTGANLRNANLLHVDLSNANLSGAILSGATLYGASLPDTNLSYSDLSYANLDGANLCYANLTGANIEGCSLPPLSNRIGTIMPDLPYRCPSVGGFVAWKKALQCYGSNIKKALVKLYIPEDAKRSSATTNKCRCSKALVIDIIDVVSGKSITTAFSSYQLSFKYIRGQTVESEFDDDRWNECSKGIHFFMTREEAENYSL